jgi:hypothetical protein
MGAAPSSLVLRVIMGLRLKIGLDLLDRVLLAEGHIHGSLGQRPRIWDHDKTVSPNLRIVSPKFGIPG